MKQSSARVHKVANLLKLIDSTAPDRLIDNYKRFEDLSRYEVEYHYGNGILTVVCSNLEKGNKKKLGLVCSLCHQDTELFPELFWMTASDLKQGKCPCCCLSPFAWSMQQYEMLVKREIQRRGEEDVYQFGGFVIGDDEKITSKAKIYFLNKTTSEPILSKNDKRWEPTLNNYLTKEATNELSFRKRQSGKLCLDDEEWTDKFIKNRAIHNQCSVKQLRNSDGIIKRDNNGNAIMEVYCPFCANDEYVRNCSSPRIFYSTSANLSAGKMCCRCSKDFCWSETERIYQLNKAAVDKEATITKFCLKPNLLDSKIDWTCKNKHINIGSNASNFIHKPYLKCGQCYELGFSNHTVFLGYYPDLPHDSDNVYLHIFRELISDKLFIKVGRSFDIVRRLAEYEKLYNAVHVEKIWHQRGEHQFCYVFECLLKNEFLKNRVRINGRPDFETFDINVRKEIVSYANSLSDNPDIQNTPEYINIHALLLVEPRVGEHV